MNKLWFYSTKSDNSPTYTFLCLVTLYQPQCHHRMLCPSLADSQPSSGPRHSSSLCSGLSSSLDEEEEMNKKRKFVIFYLNLLNYLCIYYDNINCTLGYQVKIHHFVKLLISFFRAVFGFKKCKLSLWNAHSIKYSKALIVYKLHT